MFVTDSAGNTSRTYKAGDTITPAYSPVRIFQKEIYTFDENFFFSGMSSVRVFALDIPAELIEWTHSSLKKLFKDENRFQQARYKLYGEIAFGMMTGRQVSGNEAEHIFRDKLNRSIAIVTSTEFSNYSMMEIQNTANKKDRKDDSSDNTSLFLPIEATKRTRRMISRPDLSNKFRDYYVFGFIEVNGEMETNVSVNFYGSFRGENLYNYVDFDSSPFETPRRYRVPNWKLDDLSQVIISSNIR